MGTETKRERERGNTEAARWRDRGPNSSCEWPRGKWEEKRNGESKITAQNGRSRLTMHKQVAYAKLQMHDCRGRR